MLDLNSLFWIACVCVMVGMWWKAYQAKERALAAVKYRCKLLDLQFLDQNVALVKVKLKRGEWGTVQLWRKYSFEFSSTGDERYQGDVVLLGAKILEINLDAHRVPNIAADPHSLH